MRQRNKKWTDGELAANPLIVAPEKYSNETYLKGSFGEKLPTYGNFELEIGCGKGKFIVETALMNPQTAFFAVEREPKILASAARLARLSNAANVRFLCADAEKLSEIFPPKTFSAIYLNFSDPWDRKKKWHKRRLTHRRFLATYRTILTANGKVCLKTDNESLFDFSANEFAETGWTLQQQTRDLHKEPYAQNLVKTEYEQKFSEQGKAIFRLVAAV